MAPAADLIRRGHSTADEFPLPDEPDVDRSTSVACSISSIWRAPGVHVVALVPVVGPVPPPTSVVIPDAMASSASCGKMKWTWLSIPRRRDQPSRRR